MSILRRAFHFHIALIVLGSTLALVHAQDAQPSEDGAAPKAEAGEDAAKAGGDSKDPSGSSKPKDEDAPAKPRIEKATFGGGCFWCTEAVFERVPGVTSVVSGYSGGRRRQPDV